MTNGLSSMGFSLPAAITAKLLSPERPVVCFTGDGGLAMVQGELRVAASLKAGADRRRLLRQQPEPHRAEADGAQVPELGHDGSSPTDIALLAQAMGCDGVNVDSVRGLEAALADRGRSIGRWSSARRSIRAQYAAQF